MIFNFKKWIEAVVPFEKSSEIEKGLGEKYTPGTFGVEIEFRVPEDPVQRDATKNALKNSTAIIRDFKKQSVYKNLNEFIDNIIDKHLVADYITPFKNSHIDHKINEYIKFINSLGLRAVRNDATDTAYGIGEDEPNVIELRTPILKIEDIPTFTKVLKKLSEEPRDGSTSAHVHIGMPENTDAFDLIAMTTLADEKNIKKDSSPERAFDSYAKFNKATHDDLIARLKPGIYTNELLRKILMSLARTRGTNVKSFFNLGTVEYRYLSSQILDDIPKFIKWIKYYLITPSIAQGRTQLKLKGGFYNPAVADELTLTRLPEGKVKVDLNKKSVPQANMPSQDLRKEVINLKSQVNEKRLMKKTVDDLKGLASYTELWEWLRDKNPHSFAFYNIKISDIWNYLPEDLKKEILRQFNQRLDPHLYKDNQ